MRAFLALTRLRIAEVVRQPLSLVMLLGLPPILLFTLALVFAHGHPFERRHVAVLAPAQVDAAALGEGVVVRPATSEDEARAALSSRMVSAIVVAGDDGPRVLAGARERLFAEGLAARLRGGAPAEVAVVPAPALGYVHYLVPGLLAYSLLIAGLFGSGYTLLRYRQNQFLKKLAATPLRRSTFVAALLCSRSALCLAQVAVLLVCARVGVGLPLEVWQGLVVLALALLGLLAFMGLGFALACAVRDEVVLMDVVNAAGVPLVFLSEIFFPTSELPGPLPQIAGLLPTTALVHLLRAAILAPSTLAGCASDVLILALWAACAYTLGVLRFRWHR